MVDRHIPPAAVIGDIRDIRIHRRMMGLSDAIPKDHLLRCDIGPLKGR